MGRARFDSYGAAFPFQSIATRLSDAPCLPGLQPVRVAPRRAAERSAAGVVALNLRPCAVRKEKHTSKAHGDCAGIFPADFLDFASRTVSQTSFIGNSYAEGAAHDPAHAACAATRNRQHEETAMRLKALMALTLASAWLAAGATDARASSCGA